MTIYKQIIQEAIYQGKLERVMSSQTNDTHRIQMARNCRMQSTANAMLLVKD